MNGVAPTAMLLSLAVAVSPASPRSRLTQLRRTRGRISVNGGRWVGCACVSGAASAVVLLPSTTLIAVAIVGLTASVRYRRSRRRRRGADESHALETALDVLVGELRVGAHPVRAFSVAADETEGPVAASLRAVAARARLGADVTAGLYAAARSSARPGHWDRLAVSWQLAADHGLAIATLMSAAHSDIAERQRFSARVASGMAGARATAMVLAVLPLLGVLMGQLIGARPLFFLFKANAGGWLLVLGVTLICAGLLWADRITDGLAS